MLQKKIVLPSKVLEIISPGMSIFIGTGAAEPRTLVKHLMASGSPNLDDLELIQLVSLGDTVSKKTRKDIEALCPDHKGSEPVNVWKKLTSKRVSK